MIKGPQWFSSSFGSPSNAVTREQWILETLRAVVRKEKPPTPAVDAWPREDWKTDDWGPDSKSRIYKLFCVVEQTNQSEPRPELEPPPPDRDPVIEVDKSARKSNVKYTPFGGVLAPLGSPVLEGASLVVYTAYLHAYSSYRRGTFGGTPSDRDFGP